MAKAFDKDSWLAQKEQRLQHARAALEEGLKALQTSDYWRSMLEGMAQNKAKRKTDRKKAVDFGAPLHRRTDNACSVYSRLFRTVV